MQSSILLLQKSILSQSYIQNIRDKIGINSSSHYKGSQGISLWPVCSCKSKEKSKKITELKLQSSILLLQKSILSQSYIQNIRDKIGINSSSHYKGSQGISLWPVCSCKSKEKSKKITELKLQSSILLLQKSILSQSYIQNIRDKIGINSSSHYKGSQGISL